MRRREVGHLTKDTCTLVEVLKLGFSRFHRAACAPAGQIRSPRKCSSGAPSPPAAVRTPQQVRTPTHIRHSFEHSPDVLPRILEVHFVINKWSNSKLGAEGTGALKFVGFPKVTQGRGMEGPTLQAELTSHPRGFRVLVLIWEHSRRSVFMAQVF